MAMSLLTVDEAASRLGVTPQVIREWIRLGLLEVQHRPPTAERPGSVAQAAARIGPP